MHPLPRFCFVATFSLPVIMLAGCASTGSTSRATSAPYGGSPHVIPGLIETEHYDEGAPGVAYHDIDEQNQGVAYRGLTQVDIEQRPDASNGHGIGWVRATEWVAYTVRVESAGVYSVEIPVASPKLGGIFHIECDGKDVSGPIQIPNTGAWTVLNTINVKNVRLPKGDHVLKLVMDSNGESGGVGDIDYLKFSKQQ